MEYRIIKSPTAGTLRIIQKRLERMQGETDLQNTAAIGMIQGRMIDMLCASDIAEKSSGVEAFELAGICPQHMTLLIVIGDTASVENALAEIALKMKGGLYNVCSETDRQYMGDA